MRAASPAPHSPTPQPRTRCRPRAARLGRLVVEPEQRDVAVGENVILALEAVFPGFPRGGHAAERREIGVGNDLRLDETLLEIGVNDAGGLRRLPTLLDGPGADFLFTGGEVGLQAEQRVRALISAETPESSTPRSFRNALASSGGRSMSSDSILALIGT